MDRVVALQGVRGTNREPATQLKVAGNGRCSFVTA
jgi:hypothetical protein